MENEIFTYLSQNVRWESEYNVNYIKISPAYVEDEDIQVIEGRLQYEALPRPMCDKGTVYQDNDHLSRSGAFRIFHKLEKVCIDEKDIIKFRPLTPT